MISIPASKSLHASNAPTGLGALPTGLLQLDEALCASPTTALQNQNGMPPTSQSGLKEDNRKPKGIPCGHVTEVFGPPGTGKTSLAYVTHLFIGPFSLYICSIR